MESAQPDSSQALLSSLRSAGKLVAKQAERMKLTQVGLPTAFRHLGQHLYAANEHRGEFPERFQEIDELDAKLKQIGISASLQNDQQGIANKAKVLAESAKAAGQKKLVEQQRGQAFAALGKAAYEKFGSQSGPENIANEIVTLRSRLDAIDAEIADLSQASSGQFVTPKRLVLAGAALAVLFLFVGIFGVGIGRKSGRGGGREAAMTAFAERLAKADQQWESGNQADAVDAYTALVYERDAIEYFYLKHPGEAPRVFRRMIDFKIEQGGLEAAREDIEEALSHRVSLSLGTPEANEFVAQLRQEREQRNRQAAERLAQREATQSSEASTRTDGGTPSAAPESSSKSYSVSKGLLKGSVEVELDGQVAQELDLSNLQWNRDRIEFTLKWHSPSTRPGNVWRYTAYDGDSTIIQSGHVDLPGREINLGDSVKSHVWCGADASTAARVVIHY